MNDRQNKIKKIFRYAMHIGAWLPLIVLVIDYFTHNLTANPIQAASQRTGRTAITLLTLSLSGTPLQLITGINYFKTFRKPLGLYAFMYAVIHFVNFMVFDYGLVTRRILRQFIEKPYIWFGLTTLIILTLMALTSYKWWKVKMGKNWKRLHQLVYVAGIVVIIHDSLAQKANLLQFRGNILLPVIYGSVIAILLIIRLPWIKHWILQRRMGKPSPPIEIKQAQPQSGKPEISQLGSGR